MRMNATIVLSDVSPEKPLGGSFGELSLLVNRFHDQSPQNVLAYLAPTDHMPPLRCHLPEVLLIFLVDIIAKSRLVSFDLLLRCTVLHCYFPQHPFIVNVNLSLVTHLMKEAYCNYASSSEL